MPEARNGEERRRGALRVGLVVARSRPGNVIGRDNQLPWRLRSDLRRFRRITLDHTVIMGRRTYESIGHPLPQRRNIVVSSSGAPVGADCAVVWATDVLAAMRAAEAGSIEPGKGDIFVIGGTRLFEAFLEGGMVDRVYLTEVLAPNLDGDAHFAHEFPPDRWTASHIEELPASAHDDHATRFRILSRADPGKRE